MGWDPGWGWGPWRAWLRLGHAVAWARAGPTPTSWWAWPVWGIVGVASRPTPRPGGRGPASGYAGGRGLAAHPTSWWAGRLAAEAQCPRRRRTAKFSVLQLVGMLRALCRHEAWPT